MRRTRRPAMACPLLLATTTLPRLARVLGMDPNANKNGSWMMIRIAAKTLAGPLRHPAKERAALHFLPSPSAASRAGLLQEFAQWPANRTTNPCRTSHPSPTPQSSAPTGARRTTRSAKPPTSRARRSRTTTARYPTEPARTISKTPYHAPPNPLFFLSLFLP